MAIIETPKTDPASAKKTQAEYKLQGIPLLIDAGNALAKAEKVAVDETITYIVVKPDGTRGKPVQSLGLIRKQLGL